LVDEGAQYFCTGVQQRFYSIRHADYPALAWSTKKYLHSDDDEADAAAGLAVAAR